MAADDSRKVEGRRSKSEDQPVLATLVRTVFSSLRASGSPLGMRATTSPPSQVTTISRSHRSQGMRKRHEAVEVPRTFVSAPHQGQGNSKLMRRSYAPGAS